MSYERQHYQLRCPCCGQSGTADWAELDGWSYLRAEARGQEVTSVTVSSGFALRRDAPDGSTSFFGYHLTCDGCGSVPVSSCVSWLAVAR
jgi:hypothetical protein